MAPRPATAPGGMPRASATPSMRCTTRAAEQSQATPQGLCTGYPTPLHTRRVTAPLGTIKTLSRFPVKSMLGEHPAVAEVGDTGIIGDRVWGLVDTGTGKVASAKHPR